jgi:hypothetical protein
MIISLDVLVKMFAMESHTASPDPDPRISWLRDPDPTFSDSEIWFSHFLLLVPGSSSLLYFWDPQYLTFLASGIQIDTILASVVRILTFWVSRIQKFSQQSWLSRPGSSHLGSGAGSSNFWVLGFLHSLLSIDPDPPRSWLPGTGSSHFGLSGSGSSQYRLLESSHYWLLGSRSLHSWLRRSDLYILDFRDLDPNMLCFRNSDPNITYFQN